jgi:hypothetical protein
MDDPNLLKQILEASKDSWDRSETRPAVRENFRKILACRTPALGAEVYASPAGERRFYHTCKSRCCPSCGYRATLLWQEDQKAILPEVRISVAEIDSPGKIAYFTKDALRTLRRALKARILESHLSVQELEQLFTSEIERPFWITYIDQIVSKSHFAGYAGRYVRRLPVSLRRLSKVTKQGVEFLAKDTKARQAVPTRYSLWDFAALLAEHAPDHYRHGIRYFGLLAPRAKGKTWPGLFVLLNQPQRSRPRRLSWRSSMRKYFGVDPLMNGGEEMHWVRREEAVAR